MLQVSNRSASGKYTVTSDVVSKAATIKKYTHTWQIQYVDNGARKNLTSYQACIDHLTSKGW